MPTTTTYARVWSGASSSAGSDVGPDGVDLVGYSSWDDAYQAFVNGDIDWSLVPADQLDAATSAYGTDNFTFFGSELWLGFNLADPTYSDARFRQAIVQAIDSDEGRRRHVAGSVALAIDRAA